MEFPNSTINLQFSPAITFLSLKCMKPSRLTISNLRKTPFHSSHPLRLLRSVPSRTFQVSAQLGRRSNRQNYLRKKLTQQPIRKQVSENIVHEFDTYQSNFNTFTETVDDMDKVSSQNIESTFENYSENGKQLELEVKETKVGGSVMWNKVESWVEQYKKDSEFWGIGTGAIFTVFHDVEGKVEKVVVNEDEIMRRSLLDNGTEDSAEVNYKISFAKELARKMESGVDVIQKNSSVAKFLLSNGESQLNIMETIKGFSSRPGTFSRMSRLGVLVLCGVSLFWATRRLFGNVNEKEELTRLEKEMLRRKIKSRKEKDKFLKGGVEVVHDFVEPKSVPFERPQLDKEELVNRISKAKGSNSLMEFQNMEFDDKIEEIRLMARQARETERKDSETKNDDEEGNQYSKEVPASEFEEVSDGESDENEEFMSLTDLNNNDGLPADEASDEKFESQILKIPNGTVSNQELVLFEEVSDGDSDENEEFMSLTDLNNNGGPPTDEASDEKFETQILKIPNGAVSNQKLVQESMDLSETKLQEEVGHSGKTGNSSRKKFRIIKSAKEAREYLSRKHDSVENQEVRNYEPSDIASANVASVDAKQILDLTEKVNDSSSLSRMDNFSHLSEDCNKGSEATEGIVDGFDELNKSTISSFHEPSVSIKKGEISVYDSGVSYPKEVSSPIKSHIPKDDGKKENLKAPQKPVDVGANEVEDRTAESSPLVNSGVLFPEEDCTPIKSHISKDNRKEEILEAPQIPASIGANGVEDRTAESSPLVNSGVSFPEEVSTPIKSHISKDNRKDEILEAPQIPASVGANEVEDRTTESALSVNKESWLEKNFHEFEPIVQKIGVGYRDSYYLARDKASKELDSVMDLEQLKRDDAENELEWMKDETLREIVFKVRDNELSGRDPFYLMDAEDKRKFFGGLEKKVEQENEKLQKLHEYFHTNIENLDYGADGISLYDPPEKIIPRWKVPPVEKNPEFLNNFAEQRNALVAEGLKSSVISKKTGKDSIHKSHKPSSPKKELQNNNSVSSKTIIEGSDGSVRAGKKSGKEYWQHTKKWSQGFLESYNAETDPEIKATMRDMGKDLDRWITEKEIKEAAELMDKIPEKGQNFIKQKLEKVKREMELFGPQAVMSKYGEYAEGKEEDYLWWLDLPFILCVELYTVEDGEQRVGFYSLEMAADLELNPKQYHVIAFEDAADCKNLCYIIQAKLELLGNGNAFVVARPPKDAFREAKANGFSVTVIRKGEMQLNVDQTMEEVEESIVEIGSKIYHDKITKERSVDINTLMKGVFGFGKPTKTRRRKRSKGKSKKRTKS